ncbi:hypothetical protein IMSHALPRED_006527 [Imshaugia aleurites]|uniref:Uncharacterized protein n=1 Tax=Imshaugia aleurites TaxID=172621 RepID=A0A8H3EL69_9LECA|nr:hypothetical protein IMSHALPRED_006527 [Imshaugia aleurites]
MSYTLNTLLASDCDTNGNILLTVHIRQVLARLSAFQKSPEMASPTSRFSSNGALSPVSEDENVKIARRLTLVRGLRPPPFQYAWTFYHDKYTESQNYEGRLTLLKEDIITAKPFWEVLNSFPFDALKLKDSVHFFKRGVKPVWEDPRNVKGGSWTFRVPKAQSGDFWKEVLMLAVGDDLCGLSLSVRFNSNLITIWNRDGANEKTKEGILAVVLEKVSSELQPQPRNYYYKKHSEHAGFSEVVARASERSKEAEEGKIAEAVVKGPEGDEALLKDVEGMDLKELSKEAAA